MHSVRRLVLSFALFTASAVAACTSAPAVDAPDRSEGGAVAVSGCAPDIATIQKTVFLPRCATSGCHAGASPAGSLDLEGPGVDGRLIGAPASECGGQTLVTPGDPDRSYLLDKVASPKPACGSKMPVGGALAADDVACLRAWVAGLPPVTTGDGGGNDAATGPACEPGLRSCASGCVDTKVDPKNCGTCGNACAVACADGACVTACPPQTTNCSNACVDTATSATNCGACGTKCSNGKVCVASACSCGTSVSFANQLQPILTADCATVGCHVGVQPKAGLPLAAGKSFAALVNVASSACAGKLRVVPGAVDQSYLMNKLTGVGMCAGTMMPKTGGALPLAQIDLFRAWICNGAPNN